MSAAALPRAIYDGDIALSHHATVELQDGHGATHRQRRLGESGSVAGVGIGARGAVTVLLLPK